MVLMFLVGCFWFALGISAHLNAIAINKISVTKFESYLMTIEASTAFLSACFLWA